MKGSRGMAPALRRRVQRGAYLIDEYAVAEAILRRSAVASGRDPLLQAMRVATGLEPPAVRRDQLDALTWLQLP